MEYCCWASWDCENIKQRQRETSYVIDDLAPARTAAVRNRSEEARELQLSADQENHGETSKLTAVSLDQAAPKAEDRLPDWSSEPPLQAPTPRRDCSWSVPPFGKICGWTRRKFSWKTPWSSGWRREATTSFFCRGGEATESRRAGSQVKKRE